MTTTATLRPRLARPRRVVLGGVCLAVARHLDWSVGRTRVIAILLALAGGAGVLLYLWLWALVPLEDPEQDDPAAVRRATPVAAAAVAVAGLIALVSLVAPQGSLTVCLIAVTLAAGVAVAWSLGFDRTDPGRTATYGLWIRAAAVASLATVGLAALVSRPTAINAVLGVGVLVLAVAVIVAPRVVGLWSDLIAERTTRVRQEQRAEIAAHLHDSVLQTLALIQIRAGASTEVARIARAQERELRDWLFAGDVHTAADLATELREVAAVIELDYAVRIEVVAVGDVVDQSSAPVMAATREAMLNAARHAGGEVAVYVERSATALDVFVRDRGPGIDLAALPADRLGIRESIIGRMTRAGGTATVGPGAGGIGTEVHLHLEDSP